MAKYTDPRSLNPTYSTDEQVASQYRQANDWAEQFPKHGYKIEFRGLPDEPAPFHYEWVIFAADGSRIASIDIDGAGASWHGPTSVWDQVLEAYVND